MKRRIKATPEERPDNSDYTDVRLARPHTHASCQHQAGETITVSAADARWLIEHGIGAAVAAGNHAEE